MADSELTAVSPVGTYRGWNVEPELLNCMKAYLDSFPNLRKALIHPFAAGD